MATLHCSYCDSVDLIPYMVKYYKCLDCGRIVIKPIVMPDAVQPVVEEE
jgi:DNA-directed RNA polymerase subunit RPC12/RpoP